MTITEPLNIGQVLTAQARLQPDRVGARDLTRQMTFRLWNERACRLANALSGLGLAKGDRVAVLAYNRIEWAEIFAAAAKAGIIAVPINFRLTGVEVQYIVENSGATAIICEDVLAPTIEAVRSNLDIAADRYILVGGGSGAAPLLFFHQTHPELVDALVLGFRHSGADTLFPDLDLVVEAVSGKRAHDRLAELWRPGLGIIACGPEPMLRAIAAQHRGEPDIYVSLEARLGCGIGSCLGCSVPTTDGARRICRDGPLFACSELAWLH